MKGRQEIKRELVEFRAFACLAQTNMGKGMILSRLEQYMDTLKEYNVKAEVSAVRTAICMAYASFDMRLIIEPLKVLEDKIMNSDDNL